MGWWASSRLRVAGDLAGDADLLLVASRQRAGQRARAAAAHVVLLEQVAGAGVDAPDVEPAALGQRRLVVLAQRQVLGQREVEHQPAQVAVLGDVRHAGVAGVAHAPPGHLLARRSLMLPDDGVAQAGDRLDQLVLAVAVDPGERHDLAAAHGRATRPARPPARGRRARRDPRPPAPARRGFAAAFSTRSSTSRPTIRRARLCSVAPSVGTVSTFLPRRSTVTRSAISSTSPSLWLMKTIATPSAFSAPQHLEQLARLLGGQHGGRLVEHEDAGVAVERLQDLDALLGPDGHVLDDRVGVDGQAVALGQLAHLAGARRGRRAARRHGAARCRARCSRSRSSPGTSMKCWCTMPMPRSIAFEGESTLTGSPSTRISPSSGW